MRPNPKRLQTRLAVRHARSIRAALRATVDIDQILDRWYGLHHPDMGEQTNVSGVQGRDWARMNVPIIDTQKLYDALGRLYADATILAQDISAYEIARAVGLRKSVSLSQEQLQSALRTQWNNWKPGNRAAAALLEPKGSLQALLRQRNITIRGLSATTIDRIGVRLADGLRVGWTRKQMADSLSDLIGDPVRATLIAGTETTRAVTQASKDAYAESGVEMVEYLVADPCVDCAENEKASPLPLGDEWPNGDPPVHPNCMCAIVPYVVYDEKPGSFIDIAETVEQLAPVIPIASPFSYEGYPKQDIETYGIYTTQEMKDLQAYQLRQGFSESKVEFDLKEALSEYKGNGYRSINNYLRNPEKTMSELLPSEVNMVVARANRISRLIDTAPALPTEITSYRGVGSAPDMVEMLRNLQQGQTIQMNGFVSTSLNAKVALDFVNEIGLGKTSYVIKIINPAGTKGIMVEGFFDRLANTEAEWLLPHGTKFQVIANNGKMLVVKVIS